MHRPFSVQLDINLSNAAFEEDFDGAVDSLSRQFRHALERARDHMSVIKASKADAVGGTIAFALRDLNGNTVGLLTARLLGED